MNKIIENRRKVEALHHGVFSAICHLSEYVGYEFKINEALQMKLTATVNPESMPTISVETEFNAENGCYCFHVTAEFPTLVSKELKGFYSIESYINKWQKIGELISLIQEFVYYPSKYENEEC